MTTTLVETVTTTIIATLIATAGTLGVLNTTNTETTEPTSAHTTQVEHRETINLTREDGSSCQQGGILPASVPACE